jgi:subtilisin family serine protease
MLIKSVDFKKLSPIVWYGNPIYKKENQITSVLEELEGEALANFLLPTKETEDGFAWEGSRSLRAFDELKSSQKELVLAKLKNKTKTILEISKKLKASDVESQKELGELLSLAIEFPDLSFVFVDKNLEPFISGWGFKWADGRSTSGRILQQIFEKEEEIKQQSNPKIEDSSQENPQNSSTQKEQKGGVLIWILAGLLAIALLVIGYLLFDNIVKSPQNSTNTSPTHQQNSQTPSQNNPKYPPIPKSDIKKDENLPGKPKVAISRAIVVLKDGADFKAFKDKLNNISGIEVIFENDILKTLELKIDSKDKIEKIKNFPEVEGVEFEKILSQNFIPNDPFFSRNHSSQIWHLKEIKAFDAWNITRGSPKTVIAVIDGSFDLNHPELKGKTIIMPYNATLGVEKIFGFESEGLRHGTHVSALAVGSINNLQGSSGVCPECALMPIELESGQGGGYSSMAKIRGVLWAIEHGADVVNLSLGLDFGIDFRSMPLSKKRELRGLIKASNKTEILIYKRLYTYAKSKNVVLVYAVGNEDMFVDIDPAKVGGKDTILVSAIDKNRKKADFSNFGKNVDVSAPGVDIVSAVPNQDYASMSGTSMASPIVAGVVGLMKTVNPNMTLDSIKSVIKLSSNRVEFPSGESIGGLVNANLSLSMAYKLAQCKNINNSDSNSTKVKKGQSMKMPKKNNGIRFSYGLWKSNTPLINKNGDEVEVFYYISKNGSYRKIVEPNDECKGDASPSLNGRILYIDCREARCKSNQNIIYSPTKVECRPDKNDIVICKSQGDTSTANFELVKVR